MGVFSLWDSPYLKARELAYRAVGQGCVEKSILVLGSPRSGTTWLAQIIAALPEYKHLDEPLRLAPPLVRRLNLQERNCITPSQSRPNLKHYLRLSLEGKVDGNYQVSGTTKVRRIIEMRQRPQVVAKFMRANRMAHWIAANFNVRGIVLIVRHPCAVVASHFKKWGSTAFPHSSQEEVGREIPRELYNRFRSVLQKIKAPKEKVAAAWALDTFCSLQWHGSPPGYVLSYEHLVSKPENTLRDLFGYLDASVPEPVWQHIDVPSRSAASDLSLDSAEKQLSKWKRKLSDTEVGRILEIAHSFGLNIYTEQVYPDKKLRSAYSVTSTSSSGEPF